MSKRATNDDFKTQVTPKNASWVRPFYVSLVKTYLTERGITFSWFMDQTGVSKSQWSKFERGERNPAPTFRKAASLALQVPEDDLFLKVMAKSRADIIFERDPEKDTRIIRVLLEQEARGKTTEVELWKLDDAKWKRIN